MKKRVLAAGVVLALVLVGVWMASDRLGGGYSRREILGRSPQEIQARYGPFHHIFYSTDGAIGKGEYRIRENGPELIMSYDDSEWLVVDFAQGVAVDVYVRQGQLGG